MNYVRIKIEKMKGKAKSRTKKSMSKKERGRVEWRE